MPEQLIDGRGNVVGPAAAVPTTPEQEQLAATKLAKARKSRATRQAGTEATGGPERNAKATTGASTPGDTAAPESERTEPQLTAGPTDLETYLAAAQAQTDAEHRTLMARAGELGLHFPKDISIKLLRRKVEDAELEARQLAEPLTPMEGPSDAEYDAAQAVWHAASERFTALVTEQAGLPGRIEDAVASGDYPQVQALRQRRAELPFAIQTAELDAAKARLPFYQLRSARARIAKQQARAASASVHAEFEAFKQRTYEAANAASEAANAASDAARDVGATQRELDRLMAELRG